VPSPAVNQYRGRVVVEGMEWADGVTRPILVVKGRSLGEALLSEHASPDAARDLFHSAVSQMRRDESHPTYRRSDSMRVTERRFFAETRPALYEGTIHGDVLINGSLSVGQRAGETAAARMARDIDNEVLRNMAVINPGRMFRGSPLYQDYPPAEGALGLAGAVTSAAVAQTGSVNITPRITMEDIDRAAEMMDRLSVTRR
jgi:hypothetical protein